MSSFWNEIDFHVNFENTQRMMCLTAKWYFKGNCSRNYSLRSIVNTFEVTGRPCAYGNLLPLEKYLKQIEVLTGSEKTLYASCRNQLHVLSLCFTADRRRFLIPRRSMLLVMCSTRNDDTKSAGRLFTSWRHVPFQLVKRERKLIYITILHNNNFDWLTSTESR